MRLKSYFAPSVDEAIQRARLELGPEAMLLNSRKIAPEQAHLGSYEVVFGITGEALQRKPAPVPAAKPGAFAAAVKSSAQAATPAAIASSASSPAVSAPVKPVAAPVLPVAPPSIPATVTEALAVKPSEKQSKRKARKSATARTPIHSRLAKPAAEKKTAAEKAPEAPALADELAELRKQIQAVQNSLSQAGPDVRNGPGAQISQEEIYQQLLDFDFSDRIAKRFVEVAASLAKEGHTDTPATVRLAHALIAEINSRFDVAPRVGREGSDRRVVMFVGPPGAGKTTTIVKLAVKLGIQRRIPVQLLSLDTMRVGGSEQLAEYARIIGVDFRALYSTAALDEVLHECSGKKLVLIDTPGYAPAEMDEAEENAYFLRRHPEIEVQLVLPASLRASAFEKFSERFSVFSPTKLLFTHLDEVDTFGPLLEHAMKTRLPVSYLTDGQSIPQDIEEASKARLTEGLFEGLGTPVTSAA